MATKDIIKFLLTEEQEKKRQKPQSSSLAFLETLPTDRTSCKSPRKQKQLKNVNFPEEMVEVIPFETSSSVKKKGCERRKRERVKCDCVVF